MTKTLLPLHNAKFPLGQVVMTAAARDALPVAEMLRGLIRHASGDWGEVCADDAAENELSLKEGFRLLSSYRADDTVFWVITEADRSVTTVLLPEDY